MRNSYNLFTQQKKESNKKYTQNCNSSEYSELYSRCKYIK